MLPEYQCIFSILLFLLALWLFFFYRRRKSTDWTCPKTMCFTEFSGLRREASGLNLGENHVFYTVCGVARRRVWIAMCFTVFSGLRREASGLDMSERESTSTVRLLLAADAAAVSHPFPPHPFLLSPPCPGRRPAVRRKPLNLGLLMNHTP